MNARELLDEDRWGLETHLETSYSQDISETILRALRLLDAAESNDGTTPETDAVERQHGLDWFGIKDERDRYIDSSTRFREIALRLERERNGLAARVAELEPDAERYRYLRENCRYGFDGTKDPQLVHATEDAGSTNPNWRKELDAAIDAARGSKP